MFLRATTKQMLEQSIGRSVAELAAMDAEQELSFLESVTGRKPFFSRKVDHRVTARNG